jgi:dTMP kinase
MIDNNYKGKFIVFEGLDGSGRSTQVVKLGQFLTDRGFNVVTTKEPTIDSAAGRKIKEILTQKIETDPMELQRLYAQDRKEHLENKIIPALEEGKIVISDRYFFSTFAYGSAHGADLEKLIELNNNFLYPDMIILFKIDAKACMDRIEKRGDLKEFFEREEMLEKVSQVYDDLSLRFKNFKIIDAKKSKEEVFNQIKDQLLKEI